MTYDFDSHDAAKRKRAVDACLLAGANPTDPEMRSEATNAFAELGGDDQLTVLTQLRAHCCRFLPTLGRS